MFTTEKLQLRNTVSICIIISVFVFLSCNKDAEPVVLNGIYENTTITKELVKEFNEGIYYGTEIPSQLKTMQYGRIEIDFNYNGNGLNYFAPLFYYGSINKNDSDNAREETKFNLAIEIGHYNVIPTPVEFLFYTISTQRYPQYCRDTYYPIFPGKKYTAVFDKKPEGTILQLKQGDTILNSFTHAFFPDSSQFFFADVHRYTEANKGDSLQEVLMVGNGFAGIEPGLHKLNGKVSSLRIYHYVMSTSNGVYTLKGIKTQLTAQQCINYALENNLLNNDATVRFLYKFQPYNYIEGKLIPNGEKVENFGKLLNNGSTYTFDIKTQQIGFYQLYPQTVNSRGEIINESQQPFEVWIYPHEWKFDY